MKLELTIARNNMEEEIKLISSEWHTALQCADELLTNITKFPESAKNDITNRMVEELKKILGS